MVWDGTDMIDSRIVNEKRTRVTWEGQKENTECRLCNYRARPKSSTYDNV